MSQVIYCRKNGRVAGNAQRQRADGDDTETGRPQEHARTAAVRPFAPAKERVADLRSRKRFPPASTMHPSWQTLGSLAAPPMSLQTKAVGKRYGR